MERQRLIDFLEWFTENAGLMGDTSNEYIVDTYMSINQPNGEDRVVSENEPQKEVCTHSNTRIDGGGKFFAPQIICVDCGDRVG